MRHDVKHFSGEREKQTMSDVPAHTWFFPVRDEIGLKPRITEDTVQDGNGGTAIAKAGNWTRVLTFRGQIT
jgi:hypothetical protein